MPTTLQKPARLVRASVLAACVAAIGATGPDVQVKGEIASGIAPAWSKGIQPISSESYYNAIACGKQGGANPPCVFWDTGLCKNDDFVLTWYTPYKQVAYEVWQAVSRHQPAPTPNYAAAQRTRVTIGIAPAPGSKNPITSLVIRRGATAIEPATRSLDDGVGRFIFDPAVFAPTGTITIRMIGKARTVSCTLDKTTLARMR